MLLFSSLVTLARDLTSFPKLSRYETVICLRGVGDTIVSQRREETKEKDTLDPICTRALLVLSFVVFFLFSAGDAMVPVLHRRLRGDAQPGER